MQMIDDLRKERKYRVLKAKAQDQKEGSRSFEKKIHTREQWQNSGEEMVMRIVKKGQKGNR